MGLLSSNVSNSLLAEADLKLAIHKVLLSGQCEKNLEPSKLTPKSSDSRTLASLTRYQLPNPTGVEIIKAGENFRDYLGIVKIELAGEDTEMQREFKVYYTRERAQHLRTRENKPCTETDTTGCYVNKCNIEYEVTVDPDTSDNVVTTCTLLDCFSLGNGSNGQSVNCYTVDTEDEASGSNFSDNSKKEKGRTLVGCGGTSDIEKSGEVAFGYGAGAANTTGHQNTFIGYKAGHSNNTGYLNTFIGHKAGEKNTIGGFNIFLGGLVGTNNTTGTNNIFMGIEAGKANIGGGNNIFLGYQSGNKNTASDGVFIGSSTGLHNTTGYQNIFIGSQTAEQNTTGYANVFLGPTAGMDNTTGYQNIFIGRHAGTNNTTESNRLNIGNFIYGLMSEQPAPNNDVNKYPTEKGINVLGNIKKCDSLGDNCKEVSTVQDSVIQELKDKITKLCNELASSNPTVCD